MRLDGKIAVITGVSSGMGRAMALNFTAAGALVVGGDIDATALDELTAQIAASGGKFVGQKCNVAQRSEAEALIARAVEAYGGLDVLVNNAGVMDHFQGVADVSDEIWERMMKVNVYGPMCLSRAAIPHMLKRGGGSIVNIGSAASYSGAPAGAAYVASKHAIAGLTQSTAWQYAKQNIRCNTIAPGGVPTNVAKDIPQAIFESDGYKRAMPYMGCMPRMVRPEDIANMALFLASDLACNISGTIVPVDAGWCAVGA
jgi:NAD(P)-dependent dehydrogenase (short-subunit alcohol dehydrogenase family)